MRIIIVGAGAAGCFAAANLNLNSSDEVIILEKTGKALQKVKVSGGGRCNVTHACFEQVRLLKKYPRGLGLLKKTLNLFSPQHTIDWFKERGVELHTEKDGRMFPTTNSSQTIMDVLLKEIHEKRIKIHFYKPVKSIQIVGQEYRLTCADQSVYMADKVLISTGGYPKLTQFEWMKELGQNIKNPVPSLFTFNLQNTDLTQLMGLSVEEVQVSTKVSHYKSTGPILITHWGLSGPAVLKLSAFAARDLAESNYETEVRINWMNHTPNETEIWLTSEKEKHKNQKIYKCNPEKFPKRLWAYFLNKAEVNEETVYHHLSKKQTNNLISILSGDTYASNGKTTFKEEFVTCGGIAVNQVHPQTLESKTHPNLYFAGEALDVDGITGGFNFQHAWSSAFIAARSMSRV